MEHFIVSGFVLALVLHLDTDTVRNSLDFVRNWERGTTFWCPSIAMFSHN